MNKLAMCAAAMLGTLIQGVAFGAPSVVVTTQSPIGVSGQPVAQLINQGGDGDTECEAVSDAFYLCEIDGKYYLCGTNDHPDKDNDCRPYVPSFVPRSVRSIAPIGVLRAR
jgi:hypothetical protein